MAQRTIKRALISVYDKTGVVDFARALVNEFGIEIISTGGTAALLKEDGIPVTLVEEITGFPELLDGRVKTLHPKIFAGILADRDNPEHMRQLEEQGIKPIDMVVVNLYPFEKTVADPNCTFEQAIEMIDIGGVSLLRAAAKNLKDVLTITEHYDQFINKLRSGHDSIDDHVRLDNAKGLFAEVSYYDQCVWYWLQQRQFDGEKYFGRLSYLDWGNLLYGENPHQLARLWQISDDECTVDLTTSDYAGDEDWQQSKCSFNNFLDAGAALTLCYDIANASAQPLEVEREQKTDSEEDFVVCFVKHTNPCGSARASSAEDSYRMAYCGDPHAAMGGVLACSFAIDVSMAETVLNTYGRFGKQLGAGGFFLDVWLATEFSDDAINLIRNTKDWGKRVRLFSMGPSKIPYGENAQVYRSIPGGMLVQTPDTIGLNEPDWKVVTKRKPTESELADIRLAWLIAKHTKSNAISICTDGMLIGNGAGQMSRVMSCRIAVWLAQENGHAEKLKGSVAASDGFFPFDDGPKLLMDAGVTAIIQPGGSKRDEEVIRACDERRVAMIFTGVRHFKH